MPENVYGSEVPNEYEFAQERLRHQQAMAKDDKLRRKALELQAQAETYAYGYQREWCGVPVIRLADDIVVLQELIWNSKPEWIIETGVARGGGLVLSASLMSMAGLVPHVLGIDIQILPHARAAIASSRFSGGISLWEGDSASVEARKAAQKFVSSTPGRPGLLILDSNHTHNHVLGELSSLSTLLPTGSFIMVADTLIAEFADDHYPDRPWGEGNNPLTAVQAFLDQTTDCRLSREWSRRALVTEFRDGILHRERSGGFSGDGEASSRK